MLQRFWRTLIGLMIVAVVYTCMSWLFLVLNHIPLAQPHSLIEFINLPTNFPSIWDIIQPATTTMIVAPFVVLLLQVLLTGGLYGSLVRANTKQAVSGVTFTADALRAFWRLLIWNLVLTFTLPMFVIGFTHLLPSLGFPLAALVLVLRFLFLFADVALVREHHVSMLHALKVGFRALMNGFTSIFPIAIIMVVLSASALNLSFTSTSLERLFTALLYTIVMVWLLHMSVARYLYFAPGRQHVSEPINHPA